MKLISWNVNGLRAVMNKGFTDIFNALQADVFCLQETKLQQGQIEMDLPGYHQYWNYADKKGYSGTAVFTRVKPLSVRYGMGVDLHDHEGRMITLEFEDFFLITVYVPNSQNELKRLPYRMQWEDDFLQYILTLEKEKPVIYCGDLNVAHQNIDLKNPKSNEGAHGFTLEERGKLSAVLDAGYVDTFRHFYPDLTGAYSWWSYMFRAREKNAGWRIDYFIASNKLLPRLLSASILPDVMGSDHCPVVLEIQ